MQTEKIGQNRKKYLKHFLYYNERNDVMLILNRNELIEYFKVSESMIKTNFPLFCARQLEKGY